jgi:hypothetical protein
MPRFRFVSFTFLVGFGFGSFVGVALALLAVALAKPEPTIEEHFVEVTATPTSHVDEPRPSATATPAVRTLSSLEVRIGPGQAYAIIGTIARGEAVAVLGRDDSQEWIAIRFPPGSAARGWLPLDALDGISKVQVANLAVLAATPFVRGQPTTTAGGFFDTTTPFAPLTGVPDGTVVSSPRTPTPTPRSLHAGPTDLTLVGMSLTGGGHIRVVIGNTGPGDIVAGTTLGVLVNLFGDSETIFTLSELRAGETATLETTRLQVTREADVTASLDPAGLLTDTNRGNNSLFVTLAPQPTQSPLLPTLTPTPPRP